MKPHDSIPLAYREYSQDDMLARAQAFHAEMATRRTVREFSSRPVPREIMHACIATAGTAPSGANQQPWRFVLVGDPALKRDIRIAAEAEERQFYERRATDAWKAALAPLGTDADKPFLETAPWLIGIFYEAHGVAADGSKEKRYYPMDSAGIATGLLIAALHHTGLATLTHTPSPMAFLNQLMGRPDNERPFLLLVAGYPAEGCRVPDIARKPLKEIMTER
ncbi:MAG: nitroreductase family protein [Burkholderiales bacterium]|nr:nitroreductase family protein [Burkholderiales bacterium]